MTKQKSFVISYLQDNQPKSLTVQSDADTLSTEDARVFIETSPDNNSNSEITDIEVVGIHHPIRPEVRPGHFQQPEGN